MALLAPPPQPPHHYSGPHDIADNGDFFEQLTRTISKYEPTQYCPSAHNRPARSPTGSGIVGSLRVNKQLPPLPSEDESNE
ncbi:hypothetical protein FRC01_013358, partial [Tulasnella sp. 417]